MCVNLLLLSLTILRTLLLDLIVETEKHLVTVFFIFNLLLLDHLGILEFSQLLFSLEQSLHLAFTLILLYVVALKHVLLLCVESARKGTSG